MINGFLSSFDIRRATFDIKVGKSGSRKVGKMCGCEGEGESECGSGSGSEEIMVLRHCEELFMTKS